MASSTGTGGSNATSFLALTNPAALPLVIYNPSGVNLTFRVGDLDDFNYTGIATVMVFTSQMGASFMLLVILALLTKPKKCLTPIFALNVVSLLLNFMRLLLMSLYYVGPLNETYVVLTNDVDSVPASAYNTQIVAVVLEILLVVMVEMSLALQVQVVCIDLRKWYRRTIFAVSACVALVAICFRLAFGIVNCQYILTNQLSEELLLFEGASLNATAASIFFFSAVFVAKLGLALTKRRRMGLRRWGPMQIIFIVGCQTLFIPALFAILQYCPTGIPEMDSNVLSLVALFLPLSALWAASTVENPSTSNALLGPRDGAWGDNSTLRGSKTITESVGSYRKDKMLRRQSPSLSVIHFSDVSANVEEGRSPGLKTIDLPIEIALQSDKTSELD